MGNQAQHEQEVFGRTTKSKYITFREYLEEEHAESYTGCDDDIPEAFENWLENLDEDISDKFELFLASDKKSPTEYGKYIDFIKSLSE